MTNNKSVFIVLALISTLFCGCKSEQTLIENASMGYLTAMGNYQIKEAEAYASEETIEKVCSICLVNECLESKKLNYDSLIEENGFNFSNGERQRIILARAILRDSDIYIFDEALSQIDVYREKKILENLFLFLKEKTVIVISHRFHNKKCFDKVYKL